MFLPRLCIVLRKSEQLLVDLVLVIPPSLVPTDLAQIFVGDRKLLDRTKACKSSSSKGWAVPAIMISHPV